MSDDESATEQRAYLERAIRRTEYLTMLNAGFLMYFLLIQVGAPKQEATNVFTFIFIIAMVGFIIDQEPVHAAGQRIREWWETR